jgi:hypothetical protein
MANWAWPEISDEDSARNAAHVAGGWAFAVAGITTLLAVISMAGAPIMGMSAWSLLDAVLFAVVGWRVWNGSRPWAVTGLVVYCLEIAMNVIEHPPGVGILTIVVVLALVNGVRGTFALHKYVEMNKPQPQDQPMAQSAGATYMPTSSTPPPPPPSAPAQ